jgi:hypothetical protein
MTEERDRVYESIIDKAYYAILDMIQNTYNHAVKEGLERILVGIVRLRERYIDKEKSDADAAP